MESETKSNASSELDKPSSWFKLEQIETWVGDLETGSRKKLVVLHHCGDDKEALIGQLETLINGLKNNFDYFGS